MMDAYKTRLLHAVENGNSDILSALLTHNKAFLFVDINSGYTALMVASYNGHDRCVNLLLDFGAAANQQHNNGCTALILASQEGHEACVRLLLEQGAHVNQLQNINNGYTALMAASRNGHDRCMNLLLSFEADPNQQDNDGCTALIFASENGHEACVSFLLAQGADVNQSLNNYFTALIFASQNGHEACVRLLLEQGADVNQLQNINNGCTALMLASQNGHEACVRLLLEQGADILVKNTQNHITRSALILAAANKRLNCIQQLIDAGANEDTKGVILALFHAVLVNDPDYIQCIESILAGGGAEFKTTIPYGDDPKTVQEYAVKPEIRTLFEKAEAKRNHLNALPNHDPAKLQYLEKHPMHFKDIGFDPKDQWSHEKFRIKWQNRLNQQIPYELKMTSHRYYNPDKPYNLGCSRDRYVEAMVYLALLLVSFVLYFTVGVGSWLLLPMLVGIIVVLQGLYGSKSEPQSGKITLYDLLIDHSVGSEIQSFLVRDRSSYLVKDRSSYYRLHFSKLHAYWAVMHIYAGHAVEALVSKITQIGLTDSMHDSKNAKNAKKALEAALLKLYPWSSQAQLIQSIETSLTARDLKDQMLKGANEITINNEYDACLSRCPSLRLPNDIKTELLNML